MASPSVSFRISRSTEDLASTLHLLSQRLVQMEQRLAILEARGRQEPEQDPALDESLDHAERLLLDCRSLLEGALQSELESAMPPDRDSDAIAEARSVDPDDHSADLHDPQLESLAA